MMNIINSRPKLDQYGSVFVLNEGWKLPIIFRPKNSPLVKNTPSVLHAILAHTLVVAFHVEERHNSQAFCQLVASEVIGGSNHCPYMFYATTPPYPHVS
jgi:hypothetical protein